MDCIAPERHTMTTTLGTVVLDQITDARAPWSAVVAAGDVLTIIDLHGNQAVDTLLYAAADHSIRYSAAATITAQRNLFLTSGTVLRSDDSTPLMTIVADEVGNHDTVGGACSQESNTLRYGHHTSTNTPASRTSSSREPSGDSASGTWYRTSISS